MSSLSRKRNNKLSLIRNLATSLILYEKITTTTAKAKMVKSEVEHILSYAKKNDLHSRRRLLSYLYDEKAVKKIFADYLPRFKDIKSGFITSYKVKTRLGDGAELTILKLQKGKAIIEEENGKHKKNAVEKNETSQNTEKSEKNDAKRNATSTTKTRKQNLKK